MHIWDLNSMESMTSMSVITLDVANQKTWILVPQARIAHMTSFIGLDHRMLGRQPVTCDATHGSR